MSVIFLFSLLILVTFAFDAEHPNSTTICEFTDRTYFIKNPKSSESYWICVNGKAKKGECPRNFYFNENKQLCDHPKNVRCIHTDCPPYPKIEYIAKNGSCTNYYLCVHGYIVSELECVFGTHFDLNTKQCNHPDLVQCYRNVCPIETDLFDVIMHPHPNDCQRHFLCNENRIDVYECAEGFHWNSYERKCLLAEDAHCEVLKPI